MSHSKTVRYIVRFDLINLINLSFRLHFIIEINAHYNMNLSYSLQILGFLSISICNSFKMSREWDVTLRLHICSNLII